MLARRLHSASTTFATDDAWPWPEPILTYENGLPPRALIVAGRWLGSTPMVEAGRRALDWLIDIQTNDAGGFSPIGNGWWPRGGERSRFDQQPIEATALLLAAEAAFDESGEERYAAAMERCYAWFLGGNDIGLPVADPARGAGFDGLEADRVNQNQGAESTLMWLIALEHIRRARAVAEARAAGVSRPVAVGPGDPPDTDWPAPRTMTVVGSMRQRSEASMARTKGLSPRSGPSTRVPTSQR